MLFIISDCRTHYKAVRSSFTLVLLSSHNLATVTSMLTPNERVAKCSGDNLVSDILL